MNNPRVGVTISNLSVTFYMEEEYAAKITKDDLHEMLLSAVRNHQVGMGVQVVVKGKCQWTDMGPDYAKSDPIFSEIFVAGPDGDDFEITDCDDEFTALLDEDPDICG